MPGRDGTGPAFQGAGTGRGMGYCATRNEAGQRMGGGCGYGRRSRLGQVEATAPVSRLDIVQEVAETSSKEAVVELAKDQQNIAKEELQRQKEQLQAQMESITKKLEEM